jgi:hypothetical protein
MLGVAAYAMVYGVVNGNLVTEVFGGFLLIANFINKS